jgi:hypothetical protein
VDLHYEGKLATSGLAYRNSTLILARAASTIFLSAVALSGTSEAKHKATNFGGTSVSAVNRGNGTDNVFPRTADWNSLCEARDHWHSATASLLVFAVLYYFEYYR